MKSLVEEIAEICKFTREQADKNQHNKELVEVLHDVHDKLAELELNMLVSPITGRMFAPPPAHPPETVQKSLRDQMGI